MRIVAFKAGGAPDWGLVEGEQVRAVGRAGRIDLARALEDVPALRRRVAGGEFAAAPLLPLATLDCEPPRPPAGKVVCVGVNYADHVAEMKRERPAHPSLFIRFGDSLVGNGRALELPAVSASFDWEGELAVVVGKPAWRVGAGEALAHVAGYSCFGDHTLRDFQRHTTQFTAGKNFHRSGAMGPWIVTADEIPDPQALQLTTRVNGAVMQQASTASMLFGVAEIIAYVSSFTPLRAGDVIATGTPAGVGAARTPPVFLREGDVVEVQIERIGTLRNAVQRERGPAPAQR
jgi:2-keto-4-pentenoate hydratase/2-oxohepta-3-ene-1,7-dioic acid hydratase in catechol pathway